MPVHYCTIQDTINTHASILQSNQGSPQETGPCLDCSLVPVRLIPHPHSPRLGRTKTLSPVLVSTVEPVPACDPCQEWRVNQARVVLEWLRSTSAVSVLAWTGPLMLEGQLHLAKAIVTTASFTPVCCSNVPGCQVQHP